MAALFAALVVAGSAKSQQLSPNVSTYVFHLMLPDTGEQVRGVADLALGGGRESLPDTLSLDLIGLTVDSVKGTEIDLSWPLPFSYDGRRIRIALTAAGMRKTGSLLVFYHGTPRDGLIVGSTMRGRRAFFGDNWPQRARYWLPTRDDPSNKARVFFQVETGPRWRVIANGSPQGCRPVRHGATRRVCDWLETHPIPTYTMVIGAGEFTVSNHRPIIHGRDTIPIQVWAYAEDSAFADSVPFKNATEIVETMERLVGPFPYEKLAHVESSTKFGGMENSSAIFYAERPYVERRMGEGVVRHETAHQWFGDAVTPRHFHHLWLSEGFASYFDLVVGAALHGDSVLKNGMRHDADSYMSSNVVDRPILDTTVTEYVTLLNANNYPKGAWVLHMLRGLVSDSAFFRGIREYYRRYRDSTALSDDFRSVMEEVSGRDLEWFFRQWLRQPGYPQLDVAWQPQGPGRVRLDVTQTQPAGWGVFRFPRLFVEFRAADGRTLRRVYSVEGRVSVLFADLPFTPDQITVDPDGALLLKTTVRTRTP